MTRFSRGFSELVLIVDDVPTSTRFYRDVVGLSIQEEFQFPDWTWFWTGDPGQPQRLAVHQGKLGHEEHSPHPEGQRWGHVHFALNVPRERLEGAAEHVRQSGVEVYGPTRFASDWMRATAYFFYDPDGNLIEFWSPDP